MLEALQKLRQYLLTGVSFAIPFIACGGIMIAIAIASPSVKFTSTGPDFSNAPIAEVILEIGKAAFKMLLPVLAGYIAYAIAGKPALVPGMVGGWLSDQIKAGFLGALLIGLIAGWIVEGLKQIPTAKYIKPIMPILIIPIVSSTVVGVLMLEVLGIPIAHLMTSLKEWLEAMQSGSAVGLGLVLGAMIAFDMGGPVNKAAYFFGAAMINEGNYTVMGACAAAICTPPLGLGLATLLDRKRWSTDEKEAGIAALAMGMIGITEGAIPFAAADPLRVIPCIMLGSMTASTIAMLGGVGDKAPHGGPIVIGVVDNRLMYVVAIVAGTIVTAVATNLVKRMTRKAAPESSEVAA